MLGRGSEIMVIRELEQQDLTNGFLDCLSELYECDSKIALSVFHERQGYSRVFTYVAVSKDEIVGTATISLDRKFGHNGRYAALIQDVAVLKKYQGKGIGARLVQFLINLARSFNAYKCILSCSKVNVKFYSKLGFVEHETEMRMDL